MDLLPTFVARYWGLDFNPVKTFDGTSLKTLA